jgi:hypothetical protein
MGGDKPNTHDTRIGCTYFYEKWFEGGWTAAAGEHFSPPKKDVVPAPAFAGASTARV